MHPPPSQRAFYLTSLQTDLFWSVFKQIVGYITIRGLARLTRWLTPWAQLQWAYIRIFAYDLYFHAAVMYLPAALYAPFNRQHKRLIVLYPLAATYFLIANYHHHLNHLGWTEEQKEWENTGWDVYWPDNDGAKEERLTYWSHGQRRAIVCHEDIRG